MTHTEKVTNSIDNITEGFKSGRIKATLENVALFALVSGLALVAAEVADEAERKNAPVLCCIDGEDCNDVKCEYNSGFAQVINFGRCDD